MKITFFEEKPSSRVQIPFVDDYAQQNPEDREIYEVISISRTRKRTGYMLNTAKFVVFLFEDSKVLSHVLEALAVWIESGKGFKFIVQLDDSNPFYKLGVDSERPTEWFHAKGKYFTASEKVIVGSEPLDSQNPFLPLPSTGKHKQKSTTPGTP